MSGGADLLLVGGHVLTLDPLCPKATALAVADGEIVAVGDDSDVIDWRGRQTEIIDLNGATVTPGLVDGHTHPVLGASTIVGADLSRCRTIAELVEAVVEEADRTPAKQWIRGWGVDPNVFGALPISSAFLDVVGEHRPVLLYLFDGHSALASAEALRRAGVSNAIVFPSGARVVGDADGPPTGHLLEDEAISLVIKAIPIDSFSERLERLRAILSAMSATGLTGGHVMDVGTDALDLLTVLDGDDALPLRLRLAPWCQPFDDADERAATLALCGSHGRLWEVAAVKLFLDGTIDGGTAWLHEADCQGESTTSYWQDPVDYGAAVAAFAEAGIQTATHAIGDAAVRHALDTIANLDPHKAGRGGEGVLRLPVHRVEHIETIPDDQVGRFASLGVAASMQPTHATDYTRADHSDNWSRRLGERRAERGWRCADIAASGATLVLGSDWPVAPFDPRLTLRAAQTRRPAADPDALPVGSKQALTALQALEGYTTAPARVASESDRMGRVAVGYRADLTVFAEDPLTTTPTELTEVAVTMTIVDGVVRHRL